MNHYTLSLTESCESVERYRSPRHDSLPESAYFRSIPPRCAPTFCGFRPTRIKTVFGGRVASGMRIASRWLSFKSKNGISKIRRPREEARNKWYGLGSECHVQLHVAKIYRVISDYSRLRITVLIERASNFNGVGVHVSHPKQFFTSYADDAESTCVWSSYLKGLRGTCGPLILFDANGKRAVWVEHVHIEQDAFFGSIYYNCRLTINGDRYQPLIWSNRHDTAARNGDEKPSLACNISSLLVIRRACCLRSRIGGGDQPAAVGVLFRKGPYFPQMSGMITREFRRGCQARKARSGTPSISRV
jgi:hypothetical protein